MDERIKTVGFIFMLLLSIALGMTLSAMIHGEFISTLYIEPSKARMYVAMGAHNPVMAKKELDYQKCAIEHIRFFWFLPPYIETCTTGLRGSI